MTDKIIKQIVTTFSPEEIEALHAASDIIAKLGDKMQSKGANKLHGRCSTDFEVSYNMLRNTFTTLLHLAYTEGGSIEFDITEDPIIAAHKYFLKKP